MLLYLNVYKTVHRLHYIILIFAGCVIIFTCNTACGNRDAKNNAKVQAIKDNSLDYAYKVVHKNGIPKSSGDFSIYIKYPVFSDDKMENLNNWVLNQTYSLYFEDENDTGNDNEQCFLKYGTDVNAYASFVLHSWLIGKESTWLGCMKESLAVEVVLNTAALITMKVSHYGYWGGANGDNTVEYTMFDKDLNKIEPKSVILPEKIHNFNNLLVKEYGHQIDSWYDYGDDYKTNPYNMALTPKGFVVIYFGRSHAEGYPTMTIKPKKFTDWIKPEYKMIYQID